MPLSVMLVRLAAAIVLWFAAGGLLFPMVGKLTGSPVSYRAMRASFHGDDSLTVGDAELLVAHLWLKLLAFWPASAALLVYGAVGTRRGWKPRAFWVSTLEGEARVTVGSSAR